MAEFSCAALNILRSLSSGGWMCWSSNEARLVLPLRSNLYRRPWPRFLLETGHKAASQHIGYPTCTQCGKSLYNSDNLLYSVVNMRPSFPSSPAKYLPSPAGHIQKHLGHIPYRKTSPSSRVKSVTVSRPVLPSRIPWRCQRDWCLQEFRDGITSTHP